MPQDLHRLYIHVYDILLYLCEIMYLRTKKNSKTQNYVFMDINSKTQTFFKELLVQEPNVWGGPCKEEGGGGVTGGRDLEVMAGIIRFC